MSVYVSSDWHGCYWVWEQVKKILKPDDTLYFLGDAADRGPDGWRIIKELLADNRVQYFKGNHEKLMTDAIGNWNPKDDDDDFFYDDRMQLWYWNGGEVTHNAFLNDNIPAEEKKKILSQLRTLPFCAVYHNNMGFDVLLSHAGCNSIEMADDWDEEDFLWDRNHCMFFDTWDGEDNELIIHGHTPIFYLVDEQRENAQSFTKLNALEPEYNGGAFWYGKGHKVDVDMGTVFTNQAVLLNLNTYEEIVMTNEEQK